jgi:hypothetical protein
MFGRAEIAPQRIREIGHFNVSSIYYRVTEGLGGDSYVVNETMVFGNGEGGIVAGTYNDHERVVAFIESLFDSTNLAIVEMFIREVNS